MAAIDVWLIHDDLSYLALTVAVTGVFALALRRRYPTTTFVAVLPALALGTSFVIAAIAGYCIGRYSERNGVVAACLVLLAAALAAGFPIDWRSEPKWFASNLIYQAMVGAAPVLLGRLVTSRKALHLRLIDIVQARADGDILRAETAVSRDRAQLAREMHDVVAHQVSLIAVRAGALEMSAGDKTTVDAASTIRKLSVRTLVRCS